MLNLRKNHSYSDIKNLEKNVNNESKALKTFKKKTSHLLL